MVNYYDRSQKAPLCMPRNVANWKIQLIKKEPHPLKRGATVGDITRNIIAGTFITLGPIAISWMGHNSQFGIYYRKKDIDLTWHKMIWQFFSINPHKCISHTTSFPKKPAVNLPNSRVTEKTCQQKVVTVHLFKYRFDLFMQSS